MPSHEEEFDLHTLGRMPRAMTSEFAMLIRPFQTHFARLRSEMDTSSITRGAYHEIIEDRTLNAPRIRH